MIENVFIVSTYKTCTMLAILLVLTRVKLAKDILHREKFTKNDLIIISVVFSILACLTNYIPIEAYGTTVSTIRVIIISGGILFGSFVGISSSIIAGIHLWFFDQGCIVVIPEIASIIIAGILSGMVYNACKTWEVDEKYKWILGIITGIIIQGLSIFYLTKEIQLVLDSNYLTMKEIISLNNSALMTQLPIGIFVSIIIDIQSERVQLMNLSKMAEMKSELNKSKLLILQSQINPHFLFNTLNTIGMLTRINPSEARYLIVRLSKYIRHNLELKGELINISEEIEQLNCYIDIQKTRFRDEFEVFYNIDDDVDIKIPSLIVQPLVENALEHGILKSGSKGKIYIDIHKESEDRIYISIENTGIPIDEKVIENIKNDNVKGNKVGLYNVDVRLKLMYGEGLNIVRLENGTKMDFYVGGQYEGYNS
ncbi:sensor histidine kinase [Romboutsia weinsteinii]|uniref:Sensor histidine kinase n=1 Tax=Romboutsia weinsteinii TaxID=2020949 RepID=A0A371J1C3_9FIRM|nr:histidine kinase [Romboutsia weinsteinii]RDY26503.1 sensor histidine kinase [Romboutsia weinsteinii]